MSSSILCCPPCIPNRDSRLYYISPDSGGEQLIPQYLGKEWIAKYHPLSPSVSILEAYSIQILTKAVVRLRFLMVLNWLKIPVKSVVGLEGYCRHDGPGNMEEVRWGTGVKEDFCLVLFLDLWSLIKYSWERESTSLENKGHWQTWKKMALYLQLGVPLDWV